MVERDDNYFARIMKTASKINPNELRTVLFSFLFVFTIMAAYYILRPVRDAMASDWTRTEISQLWNINFFLCLAVVAIYGFFVTRVKFKYLVPGMYTFFTGSFILFYVLTSGSQDSVLLDLSIDWSLGPLGINYELLLTVDKAFYLWVSVFSLYHLSVFWTFMADLYTKEQSNRLFAFIAAGSSLGALVGPSIPAFFAESLGTELMLIAALMLVVPIVLSFYLERLKVTDLHNESVHVDLSKAQIGGNPLAGFKMFFTNPYLLGIGAFLLFYTALGSFVYFAQTDVLRPFEEAVRAKYLARVDLIVNILTFALGMFATGRIVTRFGMSITLALVPVIIVAGMAILAFAPIMIVALTLQVVRRAGNYGITRPAREMLFTALDRETRFKAKPVIDVALYRGGDAVWGNVYAYLSDGMGLGLAAMATIGASLAGIWALVGGWLGGMFNRQDQSEIEDSSVTAHQTR
ncbi:MAG: MFS transporter [Gammaproteobacteria bacterium]|nr:MFS transporter [Chromatiales bacterium]MDP7295881.1 MFS transporter [Gammaproteobacteria bacterium]MDP7419138.1 MFS transporter [Gammaproteobacteria bacterium]MDP7661232.1 MFS transporter [Gammaproteobacteria bacterium]HJP37986.1 MFS transporter [Gammaproteobacteria bacterium]